MDVYLNGRFVPAEDAAVRWDDAGLQHAVGLFETMSARGREGGEAIFRLRQHVERLADSARVLGLAAEVRVEPLMDAVREAVKHAVAEGLPAARVRLTVTAGSLNLLRPADSGTEVTQPRPTVMVVVTPPTVYDAAYFERGVTVTVAGPLANPMDPLAGHKTLAYWSRLRTLRQAASAGAGEAIWLQVTNHLASGAVSNVFVVRGGRLLTPIARGEEVAGGLPAPVLPGVTRAAVMEIAAARGIGVERRMLTIADLLDADEAFLTNSSWGVLPVRQVEAKVIGGGGVGEMTATLRQGLAQLVAAEATF